MGKIKNWGIIMGNQISSMADKNLIQAIKSRAEIVEGADLVQTSKYLLFTIGKDGVDGHLNGAICLDDQYAQETMRAADDYFLNLNRDYIMWVRGDENKELERLLRYSGWSPKREPGSAAMMIEQRIEGIELSKKYSERKVETEAERSDFAKLVAEAFEKEPELANHMFSDLRTLNSENVSAYLLYEAERPVAAALTVVSGAVAGIYWVGVAIDKRGEGLGAYIVKKATNEGFDSGANTVILQASVVGESLYKKLGYNVFKHYRWYHIKTFSKKISF